MSLILGIDAGFVATGLALVDVVAARLVSVAVVRTERQAKKRAIRVADDDAERCVILRRGIMGFVMNEPNRIAGIVVELPHAGAKSARAIRSMALATGVVCATVDEFGLPVEYVTPDASKKAATGRKVASKNSVAYFVAERLAGSAEAVERVTRGQREHVYDAAAAVLAAWDGNVVRAARWSTSPQPPSSSPSSTGPSVESSSGTC